MSEQKKRGIFGKIVDCLKESTKLQHQITKERHAYATLPPIEKQKIELAELRARNNFQT